MNRITLTFDLDTNPSVEAALQLVEAWANSQLNLQDEWLRPLKVTAVSITGDGQIGEEIERALGDKSGKAIARRRVALHLTQREIARRTGLTTMAVSSVERGLTGPTAKSAVAIRRTLEALEAAV